MAFYYILISFLLLFYSTTSLSLAHGFMMIEHCEILSCFCWSEARAALEHRRSGRLQLCSVCWEGHTLHTKHKQAIGEEKKKKRVPWGKSAELVNELPVAAPWWVRGNKILAWGGPVGLSGHGWRFHTRNKKPALCWQKKHVVSFHTCPNLFGPLLQQGFFLL